MDNILEFDLNEIISKQVSEKIENLEAQLKSQRKILHEYRTMIADLNKVNKKFETATGLLDLLREKFKSITGKPETNDTFKTTFRQEQYIFVKTILKDLFGLSPLTSLDHDAGFAIQLAVNYYQYKDLLCDLMTYLLEDPSKEISIIKEFVMPYDWDKKRIILWIQSSKGNTNGDDIGISSYWLHSGAGTTNAPHDLIMANPHFLEDDVFEEVIKGLNQDYGFSYLLPLPLYTNLSKDRIERMGEFLIGLHPSKLGYEGVISFINKYLTQFNEKTVEYLYQKVTSDNQFRPFHWEKFPQPYQEKFLMEHSLLSILKIFNDYSCKWEEYEKWNFLKKYFAEKVAPEPEVEDLTYSSKPLKPSRKKP